MKTKLCRFFALFYRRCSIFHTITVAAFWIYPLRSSAAPRHLSDIANMYATTGLLTRMKGVGWFVQAVTRTARLALAVAALCLCSIPALAQISNVQCGDAVSGTFISCPQPATGGYPTVTAGGIDTSMPTTGAYLDVKWTTPNCSSSIVVYLDPNHTYAPQRWFKGDTAGGDGCAAGYAKNHNVHMNYASPSCTGLITPLGVHMNAYCLGNHWFYPASQDQSSGIWSTLGGPCEADSGKCGPSSPYNPFGIQAPVPNTALSSVWGVWLYGAQNVYQGHDLYVAALSVLAQGPTASSAVMPWSSVQLTRQTLADGSPCVSNCTDVLDGTVFNIDVLYADLQIYLNNSGTDYTYYNLDTTNRRDWVYGGNYRSAENYQWLRIRTNCNGHGTQAMCGAASPTPPGRYSVQVSIQALTGTNSGSQVGQTQTVSYIFTVLPAATFAATPPACLATGTCTPVPCITAGSCGGYSYEDEINTWGVTSCTGGPAGRGVFGQDYAYSQGNFDNGSYSAGAAQALAQPWNYDGGRVFWQMSDYAASKGWATPAGASLQPNGSPYPDAASYFRHCALVAQQSYYNFFGGVGAAGGTWPGQVLREWNTFPNGPAMTWWRTGDAAAEQAAVNLGTYEPASGGHAGSTTYRDFFTTYYDLSREEAYNLDSLISKWEINGSLSTADQIEMKRIVDVLLGAFDQTVNYDPYGSNQGSPAHPGTLPYDVFDRSYEQGVDLEALIEYYEWQGVAGVTQDARIPNVIKTELDWMWANLWSASKSGYHAFGYNGLDIPRDSTNDNENYPELNNLACGAYAWYWSISGDNTYLTEGDDCFQNGIGPKAIIHIWFTGKDVNQINKWAADYIGYRSTAGYTSSTFPANNPPVTVPDTVPPVPRPIVMTNTTTTDSPPDMFVGVKSVSNIGSSSVTISWSTYKGPLSSVEVDYGTTANYGLSARGTSTNCASIAACSVGCNATVGTPQQALCKQSYWNVVNITGLSPDTTYHFRTKGVDANNNVAVSNTSPGQTGNNKDFTFVTASGGH